VTFFIFVHPLNAFASIFSTPDPIVTSVNAVSPLKIFASSEVILLPIFIDVNWFEVLELLANALSPIEVTFGRSSAPLSEHP